MPPQHFNRLLVGIQLFCLCTFAISHETLGNSTPGIDEVPPFEITGIIAVPRCGPVSGGTVVDFIALGQELEPEGHGSGPVIYFCEFGNHTVVEGTFVSRNHIQCTTPHSFGKGLERVSVHATWKINGTTPEPSPANETTTFMFYDPIEIESVAPMQGPLDGGTFLEIRGTNLYGDLNMRCAFGDVSVSAWLDTNRNTIRCLSPPRNVSGPVEIYVSNNGQQWSSSAGFFSYYDSPHIDSVHPSAGPVEGGTKIVIQSPNLIEKEIVMVGFRETMQTFSTLEALPVQFVTSHVGADGYTWLCYKDVNNQILKLARCTTPSCESVRFVTLAVLPENLAGQNSIVVVDKIARIAYFANRRLHVQTCDENLRKCREIEISSESGGITGTLPSIAMNNAGRPIVTFYDPISRCLNFTAANPGKELQDSWEEAKAITCYSKSLKFSGAMTSSIVIGSDGLPLVVYDFFYACGNTSCRAVKIAHCGDDNCDLIQDYIVDTMYGMIEAQTSVTIGVDGLAVIAYYSLNGDQFDPIDPEGYLRIAHCTDVACSHVEISDVDDVSVYTGITSSIQVSHEGLPIIAYHDQIDYALKIATCLDVSCSQSKTRIIKAGNVTNDPGEWATLAVPPSGNPLVAFSEGSMLKVAHCIDAQVDGLCTSIQKAHSINSTHVGVVVPRSMRSNDVSLEVSLNGQQYIQTGVNFTYYETKVRKVWPSGGPISGNTTLEVSVDAPPHDNLLGTPMDTVFSPKSTHLASDVSFHSTKVDINGYGVVAYVEGSRQSVAKIARCHNFGCTKFDSTVVADVSSSHSHIEALSLALNNQSLPVLSLIISRLGVRASVHVIACQDYECQDALRTEIDQGVSFSVDMLIGSDGLPLLSYLKCATPDYRASVCAKGILTVCHCLTPHCAEGRVLSIKQENHGASLVNMVKGDDGMAVITYLDGMNHEVTLIHCSDLDCLEYSSKSIERLGPKMIVEEPCLDVTIGNDSFPVVAYGDPWGVDSDVKLVHCLDVKCDEFEKTSIAEIGYLPTSCGVSMALDGDGVLSMAFTVADSELYSSRLQLARCDDPACKSAKLRSRLGTVTLHANDMENLPSMAPGPIKIGNTSVDVGIGGHLGLMTYKLNSELRILHCLKMSGCSEPARGRHSLGAYSYLSTPPSAGPREASVLVSFNEQQYDLVANPFVYYDDRPYHVSPSSGFMSGGQEISIYGLGFVRLDGDPAVVRFGTSGPEVKATVVSDTLVVCETPEVSTSGKVQVFLSLNGQQFTGVTKRNDDESDSFVFEENPALIQWAIIIGSSFVGVLLVIVVVAQVVRKRRRSRLYKDWMFASDMSQPLVVPDECFIDFKDIKMDRRVGGGSFSDVWKGQLRGTNVAVKKLFPGSMTRESIREFEKECVIMSKLRHPNVVLFMGACVKPPCLVTEYCSRGTVYEILHSGEPLPWSRLIKMAADTSRGMHHLHSFNPQIIHRDLKTPNLMVDDAWTVKVGDFGLSRFNNDSTMTTVGTAAWAAPEVLRHQQYSEKADVYSMGIVLWELCSRSDPHQGMPPAQIITRVVEQNIRPRVNSEWPQPLVELMEECWAENPDKRPTFLYILERLEAMDFETWPPAAGNIENEEWW